MVDVPNVSTLPTLGERIAYAYNLMQAARRNGEVVAELTYTRYMNDLLERIPRRGRF